MNILTDVKNKVLATTLVQGKEQWLCFAGAAVKRYSHVQGKRNPSKMVGVARGHQRADTLTPYSQKTSQSHHTRTTVLSNSMKPSHAHRATQDEWVMVESSDRMWSTGEGNGKPLQYSWLENSMDDGGVWRATVHVVAKNQTQLSD